MAPPMMGYVLHVEQVRRVGRQVVVHRLLVADVDVDAAEDGQLGDLRGRDEVSALEHVLHDAGGLQADRLAAGVGARDDQNVLFAVKLHVEGHHLAPLGAQRLLQKRMAGIPQHEAVVGRDNRPSAAVLRGPARLGPHHVDIREVVARGGDERRIGADGVGELGEDADNLAPLGILQLAQLVVDFDHLDRLDVEGAARGRLVVDEALQLALVRSGDGNHGVSVADGKLGVGIDDARPLGGSQHLLQPLGRLPLAFADGATHLLQRG